jgi:transcriptional regulator with XRE-family HTH domain
MEQQYTQAIREEEQAQQRKAKVLERLKPQLRAEMYVNAVRLDMAEAGALLPSELSDTALTEILVRNLRKFKDQTAAELAERSGVTPEMISRLEHGRHKPQSGTIEKLAKGLGVSPKYLDPDAVFKFWPAVLQPFIVPGEQAEVERPERQRFVTVHGEERPKAGV